MASLETHGPNTQPGFGDHSPVVHSSQLSGLCSTCSALGLDALSSPEHTELKL